MELLAKATAKLGINLSAEQLAQFETYHRELVEWNGRMNLTAITSYEDVQIKHFLDSLTTVLAFPEMSAMTRVTNGIDVGSGGGFPGVPMKIVFPHISMTLLESTLKKVRFLEHLVGALHLDGVQVIAGRAEDTARLPEYRETFSLVMARALAPLPTFVELTLPFCSIGGAVVAHKKGDLTDEIKSSSKIVSLLGGKYRGPVPVNLDELPDKRVLIVIDKTDKTPLEFPRRNGLPAKQPFLG